MNLAQRKALTNRTPANATPTQDLDAIGPVVRHNHIAYVPSPDWSNVPGTGTGNLAYAPDFLLSAPEFFGGNATLRNPNSIMICNPPAFIARPVTTLDGIGGLTAGQVVHQPLLEINVNLGNTTSE